MKIILLGPPGSGKGTQGDLIQKKYGFPKISTGALLRKAVKERTLLGIKAEAFINRGELVSDDIVVRMVKERISFDDSQRGYVLDGFPRNIPQAQKLEELDANRSEIVLDLRLNEHTLIERLSSRWICTECQTIYNLLINKPVKAGICDACEGELAQREDDKSEVIKKRFKVYHEQTEPLVEYYKEKNVYYRINGEAKIDDVHREICAILDKKINKSGEAESIQ